MSKRPKVSKNVTEKARRIGRKVDRIAKDVSIHIGLLNWEIGVLRRAVQTAARLLRGPGWRPVKRGDKTARDQVLRTARIHLPKAPAAPKEEGDHNG